MKPRGLPSNDYIHFDTMSIFQHWISANTNVNWISVSVATISRIDQWHARPNSVTWLVCFLQIGQKNKQLVCFWVTCNINLFWRLSKCDDHFILLQDMSKYKLVWSILWDWFAPFSHLTKHSQYTWKTGNKNVPILCEISCQVLFTQPACVSMTKDAWW